MSKGIAGTNNETKAPHPIDVVAGRNLRIARLQAGLSQSDLGNPVGISFQQV